MLSAPISSGLSASPLEILAHMMATSLANSNASSAIVAPPLSSSSRTIAQTTLEGQTSDRMENRKNMKKGQKRI